MEWISVKDRLPDIADFVLGRVKQKGYNAYFETVMLCRWNFWADHHGDRVNVTHWMPLPEPPKEA